MGNFNRNDRRSGGGFNRGSGGGRFGGNGGGKPIMHKAICSECGASCELPFRPSGDRPVYCSSCFDKQDHGDSRPNKFADKRRSDFGGGNKPMFDAVCVKCGNDCQVPFRPSSGKPVYCNNCFEKEGGNSNRDHKSVGGGTDLSEVIKQIRLLNIKVDSIMQKLDGPTKKSKTETPVVKTETIAKTDKKVVKVKKAVAKDSKKSKTKAKPQAKKKK
ncbi:MAG: hypothetical protein JW816_04425 [Candidatus Buchananbacteria bacterium]|nr:hypothetical protein [Candidatus Buchananbacteria bacterium]